MSEDRATGLFLMILINYSCTTTWTVVPVSLALISTVFALNLTTCIQWLGNLLLTMSTTDFKTYCLWIRELTNTGFKEILVGFRSFYRDSCIILYL